jgi:hypothetical protein
MTSSCLSRIFRAYPVFLFQLFQKVGDLVLLDVSFVPFLEESQVVDPVFLSQGHELRDRFLRLLERDLPDAPGSETDRA